MNGIAAQKLLLIAESELNRAHLTADLAALSSELAALADRATSIGTLTSSAVGLVAGLIDLQRGKPHAQESKGATWMEILVQGSGQVARLWQLWSASGRGR